MFVFVRCVYVCVFVLGVSWYVSVLCVCVCAHVFSSVLDVWMCVCVCLFLSCVYVCLICV